MSDYKTIPILIDAATGKQINNFGKVVNEKDYFHLLFDETVILCCQFYDVNWNTGAAVLTAHAINPNLTLAAFGDNDFNPETPFMFLSSQTEDDDNKVNLEGDWLDDSTADPALGQLSFRVDTNTDRFAEALGNSSATQSFYFCITGVPTGQIAKTVLAYFRFKAQNRPSSSAGAPSSADPEYLNAQEVQALVKSAPDFQFSIDGVTDWHETQVEADRYYREQRNGGEWSEAIALVVGPQGEQAFVYIAYASDDSGSNFNLTPSDTLKYRAEIHTETELDPPTQSDFSGATWVKYLGDNAYFSDGTAAGQIKIWNDTTEQFDNATLTAGSNIDITNGDGSITIAATGLGNFSGPASSTDNAIVRFDGTGGKTGQGSGITISDNNKLTVPDNATEGAVNLTARSTEPSSPASGDIYLDDGTNTASGKPGLRRYTGTTWEDISGGGGGGLVIEAINSDTNAVSGKFYIIDASSNTVTLTLGDSPSVDDKVGYFVLNSDNTVTVARNSNNLKGEAADLTPVAGNSEVLAWSGNAARGWFTAYNKQDLVPDYEFDDGDLSSGILTITNTDLGVTNEPDVSVYDQNGVKIQNVREISWSSGTLTVDLSDQGAITGTWKLKPNQGSGIGTNGGMSNPMTTEGDILYGGSSGAPTRLPKGTLGQVLKQGASAPEWGDESGGDVLLASMTGFSFDYPDSSFTNYANSPNIDFDRGTYGVDVALLSTSSNEPRKFSRDIIIPSNINAIKFIHGYTIEDGNSWNGETVVHKGELKKMIDNAAWGSVSGFTIGTDTAPASGSNPQLYESTVSLATLGLSAGDVVQVVVYIDSTSTLAVDVASFKFDMYGVNI